MKAAWKNNFKNAYAYKIRNRKSRENSSLLSFRKYGLMSISTLLASLQRIGIFDDILLSYCIQYFQLKGNTFSFCCVCQRFIKLI